jgi:hypothetical protein
MQRLPGEGPRMVASFCKAYKIEYTEKQVQLIWQKWRLNEYGSKRFSTIRHCQHLCIKYVAAENSLDLSRQSRRFRGCLRQTELKNAKHAREHHGILKPARVS